MAMDSETGRTKDAISWRRLMFLDFTCNRVSVYVDETAGFANNPDLVEELAGNGE